MTNHWQIIESVLEDERDRHIINGGKAEHRKELDAALAFVREQRAATVRGQPQPDWSTAPAWAMWWACNASGSAKWFGSKPEVSLDRDYGDWVSSYRYVRDDALHKLPLGIDWRTTLTQRPQPAEKGGDDDGE